MYLFEEGSQMRCRAVLYNKPSHGRMNYLKPYILFLMLLLLGGCGGILIQFGKMPETSMLETSLQPEISKKSDVFRVLGKPRNIGGAMLPVHDSPREMWVYYYEEATSNDAQRIFLFVFFIEEYYDGYLWFSSFQNARLGTL
jgi:hypothetical protein